MKVGTADRLNRQLQTGKGVGADSYNGMFDCFQKIIRHEGCVRDPIPTTITHPDRPYTMLKGRRQASQAGTDKTHQPVSPGCTAASPPRS